jgi:hypothetical protein
MIGIVLIRAVIIIGLVLSVFGGAALLHWIMNG